MAYKARQGKSQLRDHYDSMNGSENPHQCLAISRRCCNVMKEGSLLDNAVILNPLRAKSSLLHHKICLHQNCTSHFERLFSTAQRVSSGAPLRVQSWDRTQSCSPSHQRQYKQGCDRGTEKTSSLSYDQSLRPSSRACIDGCTKARDRQSIAAQPCWSCEHSERMFESSAWHV